MSTTIGCDSRLEIQAESGKNILKPVMYHSSFVRRIASGSHGISKGPIEFKEVGSRSENHTALIFLSRDIIEKVDLAFGITRHRTISYVPPNTNHNTGPSQGLAAALENPISYHFHP